MRIAQRPKLDTQTKYDGQQFQALVKTVQSQCHHGRRTKFESHLQNNILLEQTGTQPAEIGSTCRPTKIAARLPKVVAKLGKSGFYRQS
jgi:hypothetical protein